MENNDKSKRLATEELWGKLFQSSNVGDFFSSYQDLTGLPSFADYISLLSKEKNEKPEQILKRGEIESSFGHRLFSGSRNPSRDTVLQLAFGFQLNVDETQKLLKVARATALHPLVKRDAVIAFCLENHYSFIDTQQILFDHHIPLIGGKYNGK